MTIRSRCFELGTQVCEGELSWGDYGPGGLILGRVFFHHPPLVFLFIVWEWRIMAANCICEMAIPLGSAQGRKMWWEGGLDCLNN